MKTAARGSLPARRSGREFVAISGETKTAARGSIPAPPFVSFK